MMYRNLLAMIFPPIQPWHEIVETCSSVDMGGHIESEIIGPAFIMNGQPG